MLSWHGAADDSVAVVRRLILILLDDGRIVQGASSETAFDQETMQLNQCRHRHTRRAEPHARAGGRIEHPCRHHDDHAGRYLDVNDLAADAALHILEPNAAPMERVPRIVDLDFLPDMGRMTGSLLWAGRTISSSARRAVARVL